jgi:hypothetical protein
MRTVRSRVLLGVGAWLLGATSATAGSLYAVGQLGNSLLAVSASQMSVANVNADLAREQANRAASLPTATDQPKDHDRARASKPGHLKKTPASSPSPTATPSSSRGVLLTSPDGSAEAMCTSAGAYLSYWYSPPGFEADDVVRGPAAVASVIFRAASGGGIKMIVSCDGGVPVKQLVNVRWRDE